MSADHEMKLESNRAGTVRSGPVLWFLMGQRQEAMKLLLWLPFLACSCAFHATKSPRIPVAFALSSTETVEDRLSDSRRATLAMEEWLRNTMPRASWDENVCHAQFGSSLRGLQWTGDSLDGRTTIVSIPAAKVIKVDDSSDDWDARLAMKLLEDMEKGDKSPVHPYIQHLTGASPASLPTAPHALRHWTPQQQQHLAASPAGMRLLELEEKQQQLWRRKYQTCGQAVSFPTFCWAMEAVHSRAFRGQAITQSSAAIALLAPVVTALVGYLYSASSPEPSLLVLGALAVVAVAPLAATREEQAVCLLPFIDSANHLHDADSQIQYDPRTDSYQLSVGPKCVDSDTKQLYISYGQRSDAELLLNYGFLPGLDVTDGSDSYITALADEYIRRSNSRE